MKPDEIAISDTAIIRDIAFSLNLIDNLKRDLHRRSNGRVNEWFICSTQDHQTFNQTDVVTITQHLRDQFSGRTVRASLVYDGNCIKVAVHKKLTS